MLSLRVKLFLAFAAVLAIAIGIVGFTIQRATERQFQSYLVEGGNQWALRTRSLLSNYYIRNRGWQGVEFLLVDLARPGGQLVLTDGRGLVIADSQSQLTGRTLSEAALGVPIPIGPEQRRVGVLYVSASGSSSLGPWSTWMQRHMGDGVETTVPGMMGPRMMAPNISGPGLIPAGPSEAARPVAQAQALEEGFLRRTRRSLWWGALGAGAAALLLGVVLVRQITGPLRRLSAAARRIAQGDLAQRVPVATHDEIGELGQSFNSMAEALAQQEEARRHLMADIAHELRTPLTVIQASLEGMQDGVMEATPERLASLHEETLLLARLINDLRDLALAEVGQLRVEAAPVALRDLLQRTVEKWQPQALRRGIHLALDARDCLGPTMADAQRLEQVVSNLIDNALRYTTTDGGITVSSGPGREPGTVLVTVADTGSGIPSEEQPRVFDRFYRGGRAHSRSGSGIGLAVVRELVARQGGRVWVESQPGKGSRFSFTLPLASTVLSPGASA